jgi:4,5-DOPA dioxygenase extradiol
MPAVFFGHGSPMNAIEQNAHTRSWEKFGRETPKPSAILCISAHWFTEGTAVTAMRRPKTIHDFGGFPQELYQVSYPAPGDPALAARVRDLLKGEIALDESQWGLDHGTWSVLVHAYPQADIPVVQLSIDGTQPLAYHYDLAKELSPLSDEGVLIAGSGNVVHNLRTAIRTEGASSYPWAKRFNEFVRSRLSAKEHAVLTDMEALGADGALSIPTPEHYLPLLYVIAQQRLDDQLDFLTDGIELGSISMMSVAIRPTL